MRSKRWVYAVLGVIAFLLLGLIYAWSIFVSPLEKEFGWQASETGLTFSITLASVGIGSFVAGVVAKRLSARAILLIGSTCILLGFTLSSYITAGPASIYYMYLYYGILCGFGVGMGYNAILGGVICWFPDMQGLVSGILLCGFGFGGTIFGFIADALINTIGWQITFRVLGVALAVFVGACALLLRAPTPAQVDELGAGKNAQTHFVEDVPTLKMIKTRAFIGFFFWSALMSSAGLGIISRVTPFAKTFAEGDVALMGTATAVAGFVNVCSGLGRILFGFLFDIIGSRKCLYVITAGFTTAILVVLGAIQTESLIILAVGFIMTGFFYGGVTLANSTYTGRVFGQKYYSMNLSMVNVMLLIAAFLGPYGAGAMLTDATTGLSEGQPVLPGHYISTIVFLLCICVAAIPFVLIINRHAPGRLKSRRNIL